MIVIMMSMVTTLEAVEEAGGHTVDVIIVVRLLLVHTISLIILDSPRTSAHPSLPRARPIGRPIPRSGVVLQPLNSGGGVIDLT